MSRYAIEKVTAAPDLHKLNCLVMLTYVRPENYSRLDLDFYVAEYSVGSYVTKDGAFDRVLTSRVGVYRGAASFDECLAARDARAAEYRRETGLDPLFVACVPHIAGWDTIEHTSVLIAGHGAPSKRAYYALLETANAQTEETVHAAAGILAGAGASVVVERVEWDAGFLMYYAPAHLSLSSWSFPAKDDAECASLMEEAKSIVAAAGSPAQHAACGPARLGGPGLGLHLMAAPGARLTADDYEVEHDVVSPIVSGETREACEADRETVLEVLRRDSSVRSTERFARRSGETNTA